MDTAKYRYSESLMFSFFFVGGEFGQFPKDVNEIVGKTDWNPDGTCCHGPN